MPKIDDFFTTNCAYCGQEFTAKTNKRSYAYKKYRRDGTYGYEIYCGYSCMMKDIRENPKKFKSKKARVAEYTSRR